MAEFSEVIKQFKRMCKGVCLKCPLMKEPDNCWEYAYKNPARFEQVVMDWAKENPEPVYPTWYEWLKEQGIICQPDPATINGEGFKPIPADIAEKLGIKPKEAT